VKQPYLSVVIPCYNEERNIRRTLVKIDDFLKEQGWSFEIVVVDDGSGDKTVPIVEEVIEGKKQFRLIKNPHMGKGYTVRTGMLAARGKYVLFSDADLATPIEEVKKLLLWVEKQGFDIAIASREGVGARREGEPLYRHLMGRVFNFLVQLLALRGINDSQCGFKLFKREVARQIFERLYIYGRRAKSLKHAYLGAFDVEVLFLARKFGYRIKEVPVTWYYVQTQRLHPLRDSILMAWDLLKIRYYSWKGLYRD